MPIPGLVRLVRCLLFIFLRKSRICGRCLPATSPRGGGRLRMHHVLRATLSSGPSLIGLVSRARCDNMGPAWPFTRPSISRPELRLGYPLNLSILVSGGIETKQDSPSNGERTGKSSRLKSGRLRPDLWRLDLIPVAAQM